MNQKAAWKAMSLESAGAQARAEADAGGLIRVIEGETPHSGDATIIWSNHPGDMRDRIKALESALIAINEVATDAGNDARHTKPERFAFRAIGATIRREMKKVGL